MTCEKEFTFEDLCKKWEGDVKESFITGEKFLRIKASNYLLSIMEDGETFLRPYDLAQTHITLTKEGTSFNRIDHILNALLEE